MALELTKTQKMVLGGIVATVALALAAWLLYYLFSDKKLKEGKYVAVDAEKCQQLLQKVSGHSPPSDADETGSNYEIQLWCAPDGVSVWYDNGTLMAGSNDSSNKVGSAFPKLGDNTFGTRRVQNGTSTQFDLSITGSDTFTLQFKVQGSDTHDVDDSVDFKLKA